MEKIINVKTLLENRKAKDNNGSNKFYNIINTIGENNTTAWKVLNEAVKEERECGYDDIIRLDFKGITVGTPYFNDYFKLLLNDRNVVFQLYNSKEVVDNINSMAILGGLEGMKNEKRAENEEIVYVEEKKVDKVLLRKVEDLKKACFVLEDGKYKIFLKRKYSELAQETTVAVIKEAIVSYCKDNNVNEIILNVSGVNIQQNIYENMGTLIVECESEGINVVVESNDSKVIQEIEALAMLSGNMDVTVDKRLSIIHEYMKPGSVVILYKYKLNKKKDNLGRNGEGKVIYSRVAIFLGLSGQKDNTIAHFKVYNGNAFYTKKHWKVEHDRKEILKELKFTHEEVNVKELGLFGFCVGSSYHITFPMQYEKNDMHIVYDSFYDDNMDNDSLVVENEVTLPVMISMVFDDWNVSYDREGLEKVIEETNKVLGYGCD